MNAFLVFLTIAVAGVGPFVAVFRGARAFDDVYAKPEPAPVPCTDDTIELPRIRVQRDPHMY